MQRARKSHTIGLKGERGSKHAKAGQSTTHPYGKIVGSTRQRTKKPKPSTDWAGSGKGSTDGKRVQHRRPQERNRGRDQTGSEEKGETKEEGESPRPAGTEKNDATIEWVGGRSVKGKRRGRIASWGREQRMRL